MVTLYQQGSNFVLPALQFLSIDETHRKSLDICTSADRLTNKHVLLVRGISIRQVVDLVREYLIALPHSQ